MGVAQGHSLWCPEVALGLDSGLLIVSALCTTTGGLLGEGGWLGSGVSLGFCLALLWTEAGLGLPEQPWAAPPSCVFSVLYFPHPLITGVACLPD